MKVFRQQDPCVDGKRVALPNVVYDLPHSACLLAGQSNMGLHRQVTTVKKNVPPDAWARR
jgi:hypothetical protein